MGIVKSNAKISFNGEDLTKASTEYKVKKGLVLAPEDRRIFPQLSVEENLKLGSFARGNEKENFEKVYDLFPILKDRKKQQAGSLSGGEQQMLAVGRSLMSSPEILMLDEPSLGLAPLITDEIFEVLVQLKDMGVGILLVEQNALKSLKISDRAYILEIGNIATEGNAKSLLKDESVKKAYLGI
jgi:branched-chain amino acid transport system ATP-binding protein